MQCNLGFTIWRCRERNLYCCCAYYYQRHFQSLCKSLPCQVGWGGSPGGAEMPIPTACLQSPKKQFRCGAAFWLAEQTREALEDAVGKILQAECHRAPIALKHGKMSCPGKDTGFPLENLSQLQQTVCALLLKP